MEFRHFNFSDRWSDVILYHISSCEWSHVSPYFSPLWPLKMLNMHAMCPLYCHVKMTSYTTWLYRDQWYSTTWPSRGEKKGPSALGFAFNLFVNHNQTSLVVYTIEILFLQFLYSGHFKTVDCWFTTCLHCYDHQLSIHLRPLIIDILYCWELQLWLLISHFYHFMRQCAKFCWISDMWLAISPGTSICSCWLEGSWPKLISQTNPYTTSPFSIIPWSADWSLTQSSMGGCWNQVFALWDGCDVIWFPLSLPSHRSLRSRACKMSPLFCPSIPLRKHMIDLRVALACCSGTFALLWQCDVQSSQLI